MNFNPPHYLSLKLYCPNYTMVIILIQYIIYTYILVSLYYLNIHLVLSIINIQNQYLYEDRYEGLYQFKKISSKLIHNSTSLYCLMVIKHGLLDNCSIETPFIGYFPATFDDSRGYPISNFPTFPFLNMMILKSNKIQ